MPIFEGVCENAECQCQGKLYEYMLQSWTKDDPGCPICGNRLNRQISAARISWAKPLGQYCGENSEGHFATARDPEDNTKVVKKFITTRKEQLDFCKQYGFHDPAEIPSDPADCLKGFETAKGEATWI